MSYATKKLISDHIPRTFRTDQALIDACAEKQDDAENLVVGMLSTVYEFPLTAAANPVSYARVQGLCARLTAARGLKWFHADDMPEAVNAHARDLEREVMEELRGLVSGNDMLTDATQSDDGPGTDVEDGYSDLTTTEQGYVDAWFARSDEW